MRFEDALCKAVSFCDDCGIDDPFYLYSVISDYVGADFAGKDKVVMLFDLDKRLQIVRNIRQGGKAACIISKEAYPAFKTYGKKKFRDFIDDLYCILTGTPLPERQSVKRCIQVTDKKNGSKRKNVKSQTILVRTSNNRQVGKDNGPQGIGQPIRGKQSGCGKQQSSGRQGNSPPPRHGIYAGIPPYVAPNDYGAWLLYQAIIKK